MSGYLVYILTIFLTCALWHTSGFNMFTWQYWAGVMLIGFAHVSGRNISKGDCDE